MKQIPIHEVEADLAGSLQLAEQENVVITRDGQPVGMLIGLAAAEHWEELLLQEPRFQAEIRRAREDVRAGRGMSLAALRAQYAE